jgi:hypothetical protein
MSPMNDEHVLGVGITQEDGAFHLFLSFGGQDEAQQSVTIPNEDLEPIVLSICQSAARVHMLNHSIEGLEGEEREEQIRSIFDHFAADQN